MRDKLHENPTKLKILKEVYDGTLYSYRQCMRLA